MLPGKVCLPPTAVPASPAKQSRLALLTSTLGWHCCCWLALLGNKLGAFDSQQASDKEGEAVLGTLVTDCWFLASAAHSSIFIS